MNRPVVLLPGCDKASFPVEYDCQTCGACCASPWSNDGYVRLNADEVQRLQASGLSVVRHEGDDIPRLSTEPSGEGYWMCCAFAGCIGVRCSCTIYEQRPEFCRRLKTGGEYCRQARQQFGLPV